MGKLNGKDELLTHLRTLTNSSSGAVLEEAGSKASDFSLKATSPSTKIRESLHNCLHSADFLKKWQWAHTSQNETARHHYSPACAKGNLSQLS